MAIVTVIGKGTLPANFKGKELRAFLTAAGMSEQTFRKKVMDFKNFDDIFLAFLSNKGRIGRACQKAIVASGTAHYRHILKRK